MFFRRAASFHLVANRIRYGLNIHDRYPSRRDAELQIATDGIELSVRDSYGRGYDTIRYEKDDLLCSTLIANLWQTMGVNTGKQPVSLKVRLGAHGGSADIRLVFPNEIDAFAFGSAMREAGLPTFHGAP